MTAPALAPGVAVVYPGTGPDGDAERPHLHILVSGVTAKGDILLVPICSTHPKCDQTAVLKPKAGWDAIKRESYAAYYKAKKVSAKALQKRIESAEITYLGPIPDDILSNIIKGIDKTEEIEPWFLDEFHKLE